MPMRYFSIIILILLVNSTKSFSQVLPKPKFRYILRVEYMNTNLSNSTKSNIIIAPSLNQNTFLLVYGNYLNDKTIFEVGITKLKHITAFSESTNQYLAAIYAREYPRTFLYLVPRYRKMIFENTPNRFNLSKSIQVTNTSIWSSLGIGIGVAIPEDNYTLTTGIPQKIQVIQDSKIPAFVGIEVGIEPSITVNYRFDLSCYGRYYLGTRHRSLLLNNNETINSSFNGWSIGIGIGYKFGFTKNNEIE
jgi:hypothetical protein